MFLFTLSLTRNLILTIVRTLSNDNGDGVDDDDDDDDDDGDSKTRIRLGGERRYGGNF